MTYAEMTMERQSTKSDRDGDPIITKAALKAAELLGVSDPIFARILGLKTISDLKNGNDVLMTDTTSFQEAVYFIRMFTALFDIVGGDQNVARSWLCNRNLALNGLPIEIIKTPTGLRDVISYLDSRRSSF
ncbi:MAG: MbcA/ParS/Xre antitoxin family protein [Candidatus Symbiobacter sp.]|nr:MbcA/ParS/Xre antitoxin family protein [Candidatus Symbiobacter sp.]